MYGTVNYAENHVKNAVSRKMPSRFQTTDISLDVSIGLSDEKLFDRSAFTLSFSTA
jgi:hypothetical protein